MVKCSNCGNDAGESYFCPVCGSKIDVEIEPVEEINDENSMSNRWTDKLNMNKTVDSIYDKLASKGYKGIDKNDSKLNRKYFEKLEPEFLEVFDSIDDDFVKTILLLEREKYNTIDGWGVIGGIATAINTPTHGMEHDEAVQFYKDLAEKINREIEEQKRNGDFDEELYYKVKFRQVSINKRKSIYR